jgi:hypothetical protein
MITVIANNDFYETIIKKYDVNEFPKARNLFVWDWINSVFSWNNFEYFGTGCKVENPAFTPEFLKQHGFDDEPSPIFIEGVCIYSWFCITGIHGSDEHYVTAYFIQTKDYNVNQ